MSLPVKLNSFPVTLQSHLTNLLALLLFGNQMQSFFVANNLVN
jgi:hypothetical protein